MNAMDDAMQQALRLMRNGDLRAATRALQQRLAAGSSSHRLGSGRDVHARGAGGPSAEAGWIEGEFRVLEPHAPPQSATRDGAFTQEHFSCSAGALDYRLYVPSRLRESGAPLLLMLHGCTQSPDDFALGTRMNQLAARHGYVVAYPQQSAARNPNLCWNWFRGSDQQRGQGEPAILAALARQLVARHRLDARRVYVAGLSAGGAMAAVLASTHPDVFAAIGVHSGLPIGLASDVPSALAAMRSGKSATRGQVAGRLLRPVPAIVFHGDSDATVHPRNGIGVIAQSLGDDAANDPAEHGTRIEQGVAAGGRGYTRTIHRRGGRIVAEHWACHGAAHAWSGGDPSGSYTDPDGPDASLEMLRFFDACARR